MIVIYRQNEPLTVIGILYPIPYGAYDTVMQVTGISLFDQRNRTGNGTMRMSGDNQRIGILFNNLFDCIRIMRGNGDLGSRNRLK